MKRKTFAVFLLLFAFLPVFGCTENNASSDDGYKKISSEEARQMMQESVDYILLDVRTQEEFDQAHIEGAVLIPDNEIKNKAETELPDKDARILVYCRSGRRSEESAKQLISMGYTNIYDFGGIIDWPYDTVNAITKEVDLK